MGGVYAIQNKMNGRAYVGCSCNVESRWAQHKSALRSGTHVYKDFQEDWDLYGESSFEFKLLEETSHEDMFAKESSWIKNYGAFCYSREETDVSVEKVVEALKYLEGKLGTSPSLKKIAGITNCTDATAIKYLHKAIEQGLVAQRRGKYMTLAVAKAFDSQKQ